MTISSVERQRRNHRVFSMSITSLHTIPGCGWSEISEPSYADGARGEIDVNYLVAWIPPDFVQLASAGVAVNPEACILWLDTLDDEFVRSLRRMGFLC